MNPYIPVSSPHISDGKFPHYFPDLTLMRSYLSMMAEAPHLASVPFLHEFNEIQQSQYKSLGDYEVRETLMKKIRHTRDSYTEKPYQEQEISAKSQSQEVSLSGFSKKGAVKSQVNTLQNRTNKDQVQTSFLDNTRKGKTIWNIPKAMKVHTNQENGKKVQLPQYVGLSPLRKESNSSLNLANENMISSAINGLNDDYLQLRDSSLFMQQPQTLLSPDWVFQKHLMLQMQDKLNSEQISKTFAANQNVFPSYHEIRAFEQYEKLKMSFFQTDQNSSLIFEPNFNGDLLKLSTDPRQAPNKEYETKNQKFQGIEQLKFEESSDRSDDGYVYLNLEISNEKSSELDVKEKKNYNKKKNNKDKEPEKEIIKSETSVKKPRERKPNQYPYGSISQNKEKIEPRRKNKWQMMTESKLDESDLFSKSEKNESPISSENQLQNYSEVIREEKILFVESKKNGKQTEDESDIDYNYLLSIMITNDPVSLGQENPGQQFSAIIRDINKKEGANTRVGCKYQAIIPNVGSHSKRKSPQKVWSPEGISKGQLNEYFEFIRKTLKSDSINEERALKLLRRKDYKREKVQVNISKNEKFYSSFLIVSEENNRVILDSNLYQKATS